MIVTDADTFYPEPQEPEAPPEILTVHRWRFGDVWMATVRYLSGDERAMTMETFYFHYGDLLPIPEHWEEGTRH